MSLPSCEQRALDAIACNLRAGEPRLASMFAIFARLEGKDGAPRPERIEPRRQLRWRPRWWLRRRRRGPRWLAPVSKTVALVPLIVVVVISAVLLSVARPAARHGCASIQPVRAWRSFTDRPGGCPPPRHSRTARLGSVGGAPLRLPAAGRS
jgi:hypothetical protein